MKYLLVRSDTGEMTFAERDDSQGVLGRFIKTGDERVLDAVESVEEAVRRAKIHLIDDPETTLYITDQNDLIYKILINDKYHEVKEAALDKETVWACNVVLLVLNTIVFGLFAYFIPKPGLVLLNLVLTGGILGVWWLLRFGFKGREIELTAFVLVMNAFLWIFYKALFT